MVLMVLMLSHALGPVVFHEHDGRKHDDVLTRGQGSYDVSFLFDQGGIRR